MVIIKNKKQIEGIRKSCILATRTLKYLSAFVKPGMSTLEINDLGHQFIIKHGAIPAPLGYGGFPRSICTSINNVVCHGIPSEKETLKQGDIINIDVTTILDGYYGDVSESYPVGKISTEAELLLKRTKHALDLSISCLKPDKYLNDCVGRTIQEYVEQFGYSVVRELGGHGVGLKFHEDPFVFHFRTNRDNILLKPGMVFTIEPMVNASPDYSINIDKLDGWTVRTKSGDLSAQFEHTVLITPKGSEILTRI